MRKVSFIAIFIVAGLAFAAFHNHSETSHNIVAQSATTSEAPTTTSSTSTVVVHRTMTTSAKPVAPACQHLRLPYNDVTIAVGATQAQAEAAGFVHQSGQIWQSSNGNGQYDQVVISGGKVVRIIHLANNSTCF